MDHGSGPQYETLAERLIREAMEAGAFDNLPGEGKPIPGAGRPDDDMWWVRRWVERNQLKETLKAKRLEGPPSPG